MLMHNERQGLIEMHYKSHSSFLEPELRVIWQNFFLLAKISFKIFLLSRQSDDSFQAFSDLYPLIGDLTGLGLVC